jgi:hypothetical protein
MPQRAMTWILWLALVCCLPLPYFMIESGRVPAAQLFLFAALTTPLAITDPGFTTRFVAALFVVQSLLFGALLYLLARTAARRAPVARRALFPAAALALLAAAAMLPVYRAPLSHGPGPTNIVGVFW